jgi:hypothetical protein
MNRVVVSFTGIFIALFAIFSSATLIFLIARGEPLATAWLLGDWIIDYSGGFIRRGLFGEFTWQAHLLSGIDRTFLTQAIQISSYLGFTLFTFLLFLSRRESFPSWLILLSPAVTFFPLATYGSFRKEILLLFLFSLFLFVSSRKGKVGDFSPLVMILGFPLVLLSHEGMFFFLPLLMLGLWLERTERGKGLRDQLLTQAAFVLPALVTTAVLSAFSGGTAQGQLICARALESGLPESVCNGAILWLGVPFETFGNQVAYLVENAQYLQVYSLSALLASLPFWLVRFDRLSVAAIWVGVLGVMPLFLLAADWGRWIYTFVGLLSLIVLRFSNSINYKLESLNRLGPLTKKLATTAVIVYILCWNIPHYGGEALGGGFLSLVLKSFSG